MTKKPASSGITKADDFLLYKDANDNVKVEIYIFGETIWLTQDKIAQLFGVQRPAVTKHLRNIFVTGELSEDSVSSKMELTAADGKKYQTKFYSIYSSSGTSR